MPARRIVIVAFEAVQVLDVTGPAEVFAIADRLSGHAGSRYRVEIVSPAGGPIRTSGGITMSSDGTIAATEPGVDTLIVAGGRGVQAAAADPTVVGDVDRVADGARRVTSVCTGAFLLAATGRLDGRRATTHWSAAARLAQRYPTITVEPDRIFVRDGDVWTSAGVTAGIDLALELVAQDHGPSLAAEVARWLVVFVQRPGGQAQFSVPLALAPTDADVLRELQGWMVEHPDSDLSIHTLAARCRLAPRTFQRVVRREIGLTPGEWVELIRVEAARRALEATGLPVERVARDAGFRTVSTLYRAFERRVGVPPATYRRHFTQQRNAS